MKTLSFTAAWVLWAALPSAQAQTMFGKAYYNADGSAKLVAIEDGNTMITMGRGPSLTILDNLGEFVSTYWKWSNTPQFIYWPLAIAANSEGQIAYAAGYESGVCTPPQGMGYDYIQPVIGRMDATGEMQEARRYEINGACTWFPSDILLTEDGSSVTWGPIRNGFYILAGASDLEPAWAHVYGHKGSFSFVKELPGGNLLTGINMDTAGAVVARLDANGNMLWCKSYIRPKGVVHDAVVESDDSFFITGYTDSILSSNPMEPIPPSYDPKLFLMKLNGQGEVQWCKGYDGPGLWYVRHGQRTVAATDSGFVLMAQNMVSLLGGTPVLLKADANGDTLWTRTIHPSNYYYNTANMIAQEDGGYLMSMTAFAPGEGGFYALMKTDALGHLPCGDQSYPVQVLDLSPVDSAFTLTPISSGATAYPVTFRDTVFDPIVTYDLCEILPVLREEPIFGFRPTIRPNPTTGRFTLDFADPLLANSYYSVYDAMGRLLFQRPLHAGQQREEIDLSRFGRGTYVVRIIG